MAQNHHYKTKQNKFCMENWLNSINTCNSTAKSVAGNTLRRCLIPDHALEQHVCIRRLSKTVFACTGKSWKSQIKSLKSCGFPPNSVSVAYLCFWSPGRPPSPWSVLSLRSAMQLLSLQMKLNIFNVQTHLTTWWVWVSELYCLYLGKRKMKDFYWHRVSCFYIK